MRALRIRVKPLLVLAVTAGLVSALGGCSSSGPAADGPVSGGPFGRASAGAAGADCAPARLGRPVAFGDEGFTNHGHATVVLDRVALLGPRHERVTASEAVPGRLFVGVTNSWPPRYAGIPPTWKDRRPVHGFRLAPGKSFNLVLGVAATGIPRGTSRGIAIYYHDSAGSYVTKNHFAMIIAVNDKPPC